MNTTAGSLFCLGAGKVAAQGQGDGQQYWSMGIKKSRNPKISAFLLSIQDSNLDWLIQSQMCYHYTNGQSCYFSFGRLSFLSKAGAKVLLFFQLTKNYFLYSSLLTVFQQNIFLYRRLKHHKKGV